MTNNKSLQNCLPDNNLLHLISQAEKGDITAARELWGLRIPGFLDAGEPLPKELASWLSKGLKGLARGKDPDAMAAFNFKKAKHRPPLYNVDIEFLVAQSIHYSGKGRHKYDTKTGPAAYKKAHEEFHISKTYVEKFYKDHIDSILIDEDIKRENTEENGS